MNQTRQGAPLFQTLTQDVRYHENLFLITAALFDFYLGMKREMKPKETTTRYYKYKATAYSEL